MADRDVRPGPIPAEVLRFFRAKGYAFGWNWADVYGDEHQRVFTAAKVMRKDVLRTLREEVDRAVSDGLPFIEFKKGLKPRLQALGWWDAQLSSADPDTGRRVTIDPPRRLRTIYETNVRQARAQGQYERIQRNKKSRPYLLYTVGPSEKHREMHLAWHGTLLPVDDPWWQTHMPMNGWGCKCGLRTVSTREADRLETDGVLAPNPEPVLDDEGNPTGHVVETRVPVRREAPPSKLVPWVDKRNGVVRHVPEGIDPGFEFPPAEARDKALAGK